MQLKAGVVGAAGFAGAELARLLLRHPAFELAAITSNAYAGIPLAQVYPAFAGITDLAFSPNGEDALSGCDIVFLAVPHTAALALAPGLLAAGKTVIDLSADFRLKDPAVYEAWYNTPHTAPHLLTRAAFGLPELTGDELARAAADRAAGKPALVACAGCYPTATSLAAAPALRLGLVDGSCLVVADAVSGVTGAGKKATERTHFCFADENVEAYGVGSHRHTPEIEQILGIAGRLVFTPHLAPARRGLLSTVTMRAAHGPSALDTESLVRSYAEFYRESPLVQVLPAGSQPRTASVAGTARAQVGVCAVPGARAIVATCAIDNLGKGAACQAVQCANIVCGLPQECGLEAVAMPV